MSKKKGKNKMDNIIEENVTPEIIEEVFSEPDTKELEELKDFEVVKDEPVIKKPVKAKPVMPDTSEIFIIKDEGNSKLVIKKDGTKIIIPL